MDKKIFRFEANVGAVIVSAIISAAVVSIVMDWRSEKRKKDVEIFKIETSLRQRNADNEIN